MRTKTLSASSRRARRLQASAAAMKRAKRLPRNLQRELRELEALPEEAIDLSDMPEITDADWRERRVASFYRPIKTAVTIRLDSDLLAWFRKQGRGYQTKINRVLR